MSPIRLTATEARRIVLRSSGLADDLAPFGLGKNGAARVIEHLGYVQVDTISVIQRAHHHVLRSRVPDYQPSMLDELQNPDRTVFEYWSHAASYLPMRDYRCSLRRMKSFVNGENHWFDSSPELEAAKRRVLKEIRKRGPLQSRHIQSRGGAPEHPWGSNKIERLALHELWMEGKIMIARRDCFQKVYDLPERVVPEGIDTSLPSPRETAEAHIRRALRASGLASEPELTYLMKKPEADRIREAVRRLTKSGEIVGVRISGLSGKIRFALPASLKLSPPLSERFVRILSPFDNLVIQRKRISELFGFDYQLECYVPAAKRKFGYFCLPVLSGETFIGRIDAKAHRKKGVLQVVSAHFEGKALNLRGSKSKMGAALQSFAEFNGCHSVTLPEGS